MNDNDFQVADRAIRGALKAFRTRRDDVADVYQMCWVAVLERLPKFHSYLGTLATFAHQVARSTIVNLSVRKKALRRSAMEREPFYHDMVQPPLPPSSLSDLDEAAVWRALDELRPAWRRIIIEYVMLDREAKVAAEVLGLTHRTVLRQTGLAKPVLREKLNGLRSSKKSSGPSFFNVRQDGDCI